MPDPMVVVIGGSAGGMKALRDIFATLDDVARGSDLRCAASLTGSFAAGDGAAELYRNSRPRTGRQPVGLSARLGDGGPRRLPPDGRRPPKARCRAEFASRTVRAHARRARAPDVGCTGRLLPALAGRSLLQRSRTRSSRDRRSALVRERRRRGRLCGRQGSRAAESCSRIRPPAKPPSPSTRRCALWFRTRWRIRRESGDGFRRRSRRAGRPVAGASGQRKRTSNVARPKIFLPSDFAPTMTTPVRVSGSSDLIRPLNSMSAPSVADTIAGADSRTA